MQSLSHPLPQQGGNPLIYPCQVFLAWIHIAQNLLQNWAKSQSQTKLPPVQKCLFLAGTHLAENIYKLPSSCSFCQQCVNKRWAGSYNVKHTTLKYMQHVSNWKGKEQWKYKGIKSWKEFPLTRLWKVKFQDPLFKDKGSKLVSTKDYSNLVPSTIFRSFYHSIQTIPSFTIFIHSVSGYCILW